MAIRSLVVLVGILYLSWFGDATSYKDPNEAIEARVDDLLNQMTLAEKIGQMTIADRYNYSYIPGPGFIKQYLIGGIISNPFDTGRNVSARISQTNQMQKEALATRLGIPVMLGIDAVHGNSMFINATIFPHNVGLGVTRDVDLIRRIGAATALEIRATGIPYAYAPCVAVCRDPRWGRCYESYSEDPSIVKVMTEIISGLQGKVPESLRGRPYVSGKDKVAGCAKHFVADGGTVKGLNENNTVVDPHTLFGIHMLPYIESIDKGISTIMVSYSSVNGIKMHANHELLTDFLKKTLKFKGFVISDWMGIDKLTNPVHANYTYSIEASINAGIDTVIVPFRYVEFINGLTKLVEDGNIPMSRIDDAVRRILRVKFTVGLFENPYVDESLVHKIGCKEHREIAREAVRKSIVLLKNGKTENEKVLPLPKKASKVLVVGKHANDLGFQCGGFSIIWQGFNTTRNTTGTTILEAVNNTIDHQSSTLIYELVPTPEFVSKHHDASYAIVVVGETPYAETAGDNKNLVLPNPGPETIRLVCGSIKCVVVLITGRPLVIEPYLEMIDALAVAWLPGTEGQGVADVLFGDYPFTGKLARTWMRNVNQLPLNVHDDHYDPLFPFGFGITTE